MISIKIILIASMSLYGLSACRNRSRDENLQGLKNLVETADGVVPYYQEVSLIYPSVVFVEGYPMIQQGGESKLKVKFLVYERYICILNLEVEIRGAEIISYGGFDKLTVNELLDISEDAGGRISKSFGQQWVFKDDDSLTKLSGSEWDLGVLGIPRRKPVKNAVLVQKSWAFLWGK